MDVRECKSCKQTKPLIEFGKDKYRKSGYGSFCKSCKRQKEADRLANNPELRKRWRIYHYTALGKARATFKRANSRGIETLPVKELEVILASLPMQCHYCDEQLTWVTCQPDRKDCHIGYIDDNITLACDRCNRVKTDILTEEQMIEIAHKYFKEKNSG